MRRAIAIVFALAILSATLFVPVAGATGPFSGSGNGYGTCNDNNPYTGNSYGWWKYCYY